MGDAVLLQVMLRIGAWQQHERRCGIRQFRLKLPSPDCRH